MAFSESPSIVVREIDLSGVVPSVSSSTGAIVGNFEWGPVLQPTKIYNETSLVETFGAPQDNTSRNFHEASYFLKYTSDLRVIRVIDSAGANSFSGGADSAVEHVVKTNDHWDLVEASQVASGRNFLAKYPGDLGNTLQIQICPADSTGNNAVFAGWSLENNFDGAPRTSNFATGVNAKNDEVHVAVLDRRGKITGTVNSVLETFPYVSLASNAKTADGTSNYINDVLNNRSEYIWMGKHDSDFTLGGTTADSGDNFRMSVEAIKTYDLGSGKASGFAGAGALSKFIIGYDTINDKDNIQVDLIIIPGNNTRLSNTTMVNNAVAIAQGTRKDCVVLTSPSKADVIDTTTPVTNTVAAAATYTPSSYLFVDNNWLKVYDKYNDKYISISAASSTAGIMAATDYVAAPWFSPAGPRRGQYLGITGLAYTPNKAERDTLYKVGVNPIANIPGQGVLLFGDKTKLARPSAFDRINVRRLFLTIERAIALAARNVMFEFNDEFTRAEFVGIVEPFLREIKGRRGITDFRVICDETNNTSAVIDRNEFIANILVKPARSINFVTLNFVAVRTGVDFEEIAGNIA
tara:strand:+ start:16277 stop:18010 length:1734 start_codon:yes stop_codon:yes gene_type:complete